MKLVIVFLDDGTAEVHEDLSKMNSEYEAIDVEDGAFEFFDSEGYKLTPVLRDGTVKGKLFGLLPFFRESTFELVRGESQRSELLNKLGTVTGIGENPWFKSVAELRAYIEEATEPTSDNS